MAIGLCESIVPSLDMGDRGKWDNVLTIADGLSWDKNRPVLAGSSTDDEDRCGYRRTEHDSLSLYGIQSKRFYHNRLAVPNSNFWPTISSLNFQSLSAAFSSLACAAG